MSVSFGEIFDFYRRNRVFSSKHLRSILLYNDHIAFTKLFLANSYFEVL